MTNVSSFFRRGRVLIWRFYQRVSALITVIQSLRKRSQEQGYLCWVETQEVSQ